MTPLTQPKPEIVPPVDPKVATTDQIPVLLDTDIGSDIDDAVALAYLLSQPRCDLLGITTVSGEPDKRAEIASAVCAAAGKPDMPIYVGIENPLLVPQMQPKAPHHPALKELWPHSWFGIGTTAISFMRSLIRSRPNDIELVAIGPLTNIAVLFALDPELPMMLRGLTIMNGQFFTRGYSQPGSVAEWNTMCDPHASQIVYNAPVPKLTAIGLDVTKQCTLGADECRTRFKQAGGALSMVADMAEEWFKHSPHITFHDPLAAASLFENDICSYVRGTISVELTSPVASGQTYIKPDPAGRHFAAETVDSGKFFEAYFDVVGE